MNKSENYSNTIRMIQNIDKYRLLTADIFHTYSISSVTELLQFLRESSQRGGYVKCPWSEEYILLPFLDDSQNSWLKFKLPCVEDFYFKMRSYLKIDFTDFFELQEYVQKEYWHMPPCSEIMIKVPIFGCWDRAEFIATFLECHHFDFERLYFYGDYIQRGHSFCIYYDEEWKICDISNCSFVASKKDMLYELIFCCLCTWDAYNDSTSMTLAKIKKPPIQANMREYLKNVSNGMVLMRKEI